MPDSSKTRASTERPGYRYYVLTMLALSYFVSVVDRNMLAILAQDVKAELSLTDSQLGLLMGLAFALLYSLFGIPVARLADRTSRKSVIAVSVAVWSVATALCGMATGFGSLFAARVIVGMGEGGATPSSHSMITDLFPRPELARALSIFLLGSILGSVGGQIIGGVVGQQYGWRVTFWIVAAPGFLIAAALGLTVREPARGRFDTDYDAQRPVDPVRKTAASLLRNRAYLGASMGNSCAVAALYAMLFWLAPVMIRTFALSKHEVGLILGVATLLGGLPGLLLGGLATDLLVKRDHRWMGRIPALALLSSFPAFAGALFVTTPFAAAALFGVGFFFFNVGFAAPFAIMQTHVEPHQRAFAAAVTGIVANVGGLGIMLPLVGWLSDRLSVSYGNRSLNFALACATLLFPVAAGLLGWTTGHLRDPAR